MLGLSDPNDPMPILSGRGTISADGTPVLSKATMAEGMTVKILPQKTIADNDDGTRTLSLKVDGSDLDAARKTISRFLQSTGQAAPTDADLDAILSQGRRGQYAQPNVNFQLALGPFPIRALVKIIYELACHWLGEGWFRRDAVARAMRRFILNGEKHPLIEMHGDSDKWPKAIEDLVSIYPGAHIGLMPMISAQRDCARVFVRVLDCYHCWMIVSKEPSNYTLPADGRVVINEPNKAVRETSMTMITVEYIHAMNLGPDSPLSLVVRSP